MIALDVKTKGVAMNSIRYYRLRKLIFNHFIFCSLPKNMTSSTPAIAHCCVTCVRVCVSVSVCLCMSMCVRESVDTSRFSRARDV